MLKWGEFTEDGTIYEAFHPESDKDGGSWMIRVVRRGHVISERHIPMIYRPTFGPDTGDVAALERALDQLIGEVSSQPFPQEAGPYVALPVQVEQVDPLLHATCHALLNQFPAAARELGMSREVVAKLLSLPEGWDVDDLYPVAITAERQARMQITLAIQALTERNPRLSLHMPVLLEAIMEDDISILQRELEQAGISEAPTSTD